MEENILICIWKNISQTRINQHNPLPYKPKKQPHKRLILENICHHLDITQTQKTTITTTTTYTKMHTKRKSNKPP